MLPTEDGMKDRQERLDCGSKLGLSHNELYDQVNVKMDVDHAGVDCEYYGCVVLA